MAALKAVARIVDIVELEIAVGAVVGSELLLVDTQRVVHLVQETGDSVGRDINAVLLTNLSSDFGSGAMGPLKASHRIAGGVVFKQPGDSHGHLRGFFSVSLRPPPGRRSLPAGTSCSSN